ncbi:hypothetical protein HPP92_006280 [Vanilla planifolia]|uniref:Uncharacterized protein n=1 Tax=Vanilla planifolia TaxID=51239 RepID=A0A835RVA3_VANPL|nr:hypothetical protein HPP92_006280 [Vanilla planifolia]
MLILLLTEAGCTSRELNQVYAARHSVPSCASSDCTLAQAQRKCEETHVLLLTLFIQLLCVFTPASPSLEVQLDWFMLLDLFQF